MLKLGRFFLFVGVNLKLKQLHTPHLGTFAHLVNGPTYEFIDVTTNVGHQMNPCMNQEDQLHLIITQTS